MSLKAAETSRCSVAPVTSARASRSPPSTRRAVAARFRSGRESEPARNQRERQSEDEREGADRDQREHPAPDAVVHRGEILRHAHGAGDTAVVRHRHRGVEQVLAERVAVALALGAQAAERDADLRPRRRPVRQRPGHADGRVGQQPAASVDHDHPRAEVASGAADDGGEALRLVQPARRTRRHEERLSGRLVLHLGVDPLGQVQSERHLERDDDQQQDVRKRAEELQAKAHSTSSGDEKRKPTPRTVCR